MNPEWFRSEKEVKIIITVFLLIPGNLVHFLLFPWAPEMIINLYSGIFHTKLAKLLLLPPILAYTTAKISYHLYSNIENRYLRQGTILLTVLISQILIIGIYAVVSTFGMLEGQY